MTTTKQLIIIGLLCGAIIGAISMFISAFHTTRTQEGVCIAQATNRIVECPVLLGGRPPLPGEYIDNITGVKNVSLYLWGLHG